MRLYDPIPSLEGASRWLGGGPVRAEDLLGRPLVIHLWSSACHACHEQLPAIRRWAEEYGPRGPQIVGVHARSAPEQDDEDAVAVAEAHGLEHPIALDAPDTPITERLGVEYVPSYFVFDAAGKLRHRQSGYEADEGTEAALRRVIEEAEGASPVSR
jgi:thiol-disulfide isomerase/thioredoxin